MLSKHGEARKSKIKVGERMSKKKARIGAGW